MPNEKKRTGKIEGIRKEIDNVFYIYYLITIAPFLIYSLAHPRLSNIESGITVISILIRCICTLFAIGFAGYVFLSQKGKIELLERVILDKKYLANKVQNKTLIETAGRQYIIGSLLYFAPAFFFGIMGIYGKSGELLFWSLTLSGAFIGWFMGFVLFVITYLPKLSD